METDWAALAVAELMPDVETIQLAMRYSIRIKRANLASRVGEIALKKEEEVTAQTESDKENTGGDGDGADERCVMPISPHDSYFQIVSMKMMKVTTTRRERKEKMRRRRKRRILPNCPPLQHQLTIRFPPYHKQARQCLRCLLNSPE